jgi:hypothetical protein
MPNCVPNLNRHERPRCEPLCRLWAVLQDGSLLVRHLGRGEEAMRAPACVFRAAKRRRDARVRYLRPHPHAARRKVESSLWSGLLHAALQQGTRAAHRGSETSKASMIPKPSKFLVIDDLSTDLTAEERARFWDWWKGVKPRTKEPMNNSDLLAHLELIARAVHPSFTPKHDPPLVAGTVLYLGVEQEQGTVIHVDGQVVTVAKASRRCTVLVVCGCADCDISANPYMLTLD